MRKILVLLPCLLLWFLIGCDSYLDVKPNKNLVVPATLADCQALLDNKSFVERGLLSAEIWADDYFLTEANYQSLPENFRAMYRWERDLIYIGNFDDWKATYDQVYLCNLVLETLTNISPTSVDLASYNDVKGQALFHRAHYYFQAIQLWGAAYDPQTAKNEPGIALRTTIDMEVKTTRASLEESYRFIESDLVQAIELLPVQTIAAVRPSVTAAYALLARVYLAKNNFVDAAKYATLALNKKSTLMDYKSLSSTANYPFKQFNEEVIFESRSSLQLILANTKANIASALIDSYENDDLRLALFYRKLPTGLYSFKGSYEGGATYFNGLSTSELYLISAEADARQGRSSAAIDRLLALWKYRKSSFDMEKEKLKLQQLSSEQLIDLIVDERRRELPFRGLRLLDLKRLSVLGKVYTMKRSVGDAHYSVKTDSRQMRLPIPEKIIALTEIEQNE